MLTTIIGGGLIATILASSWDKVKTILFNYSRYILAYSNIDTNDYGVNSYWAASRFVWSKLKYRKSFLPVYQQDYPGGLTKHTLDRYTTPVLVHEVGFRNYRVFWYRRRPVFVTISDSSVSMVSLRGLTDERFFMQMHEEAYRQLLSVKEEAEEKTGDINRYYTAYQTGTLGKYDSEVDQPRRRSHRMSQTTEDESASKASSRNIYAGYMPMLYQLGVGRSVNYTPEDLMKMVARDDQPLEKRLYISPEMKQVKQMVKSWLDRRRWFESKGITWRRGAMLYGPPGTGKTSMINMVGQSLNMPVWTFNLATFTNEDFIDHWRRAANEGQLIVVLEDIDGVFDGDTRTNKESQTTFGAPPISMDCLLNVLDGSVRHEGIFLFITTNHYDRVDAALKRPGRLDRTFCISALPREGYEDIASKILDDIPGVEAEVQGLIEQFTAGKITGPEGEVLHPTPALFKERCIEIAMRHFNQEEQEQLQAHVEEPQSTDKPVSELTELTASYILQQMESGAWVLAHHAKGGRIFRISQSTIKFRYKSGYRFFATSHGRLIVATDLDIRLVRCPRYYRIHAFAQLSFTDDHVSPQETSMSI